MQSPYYFASEYLGQESYLTAARAKYDVELILKNNNWIPLDFSSEKNISTAKKINIIAHVIKTVIGLPSNAVVFINFPVISTIIKLFLRLLRQRKSIQIIICIHDLDGIRNQSDKQLKKEQAFIKRYKFFIVQNNTMKKYFEKIYPNAISVPIEIFDYIAPIGHKKRSIGNTIVIAGNLVKSPYIKQLENVGELHFNIYGEQNGLPNLTNITYKGAYDSAIISTILEGSFGLIWDGDAISSCNGPCGKYLSINSPHKTSLYLLAGLPLIVPEDAAIKDFVVQHNIGIVIHSIPDIESKINGISQREYDTMCANIQLIAQKIHQGKNLISATDQLISKM